MGAFYLISGNEDFSVKEAAGDLLRKLCGENPEDDSSLEIIRGDTEGEKFSIALDSLLDSLETPSFLSPSKTIWLKHYNKFDEAFAEASTKKKPSRIDLISNFIKDGLPSDVTLIIDCPMLDRRKAFFKLCEKLCKNSGGELMWFEKTDLKMRGAAQILHRKIKELALNAGKRMDDAAAAYIAETIGSDAAALKNEIDKLISYTGNGKLITLEDCTQICSRNSDTLSWEFAGALAERNPGKALQLIPSIIETLSQDRGVSSNPELLIVAAAHSEFQRLLSIKCEGLRFEIPRNASADYFYRFFDEEKASHPDNPLFRMHPFRAFKIWENAARFSQLDLARVFRALLETYKAMVTGADSRLALESLVTKVAGLH